VPQILFDDRSARLDRPFFSVVDPDGAIAVSGA
jgi:hypothetical protein